MLAPSLHRVKNPLQLILPSAQAGVTTRVLSRLAAPASRAGPLLVCCLPKSLHVTRMSNHCKIGRQQHTGGAGGLTARPWVQHPSPEGFRTFVHTEKLKKGKEICCQDVNLKQRALQLKIKP